jgi:hypothetical protein
MLFLRSKARQMPTNFDKPIDCSECKATFAVDSLSAADYDLLQDLFHLERFQIEASRLLAFRALCKRCPAVEELIRPEAGPVPIQATLSIELRQRIGGEFTAEEVDLLDSVGRYYTLSLAASIRSWDDR